MAKYTVTHSCGHTQTHDLFGPGKDRERKIAWMENQPCTDCWKAEKREADAKLPITMSIHTNGMDTDEHGNVLAEACLTGGTLPRKDEIKSLGYRWGTPRGGIINLLSSADPRCWIKTVHLAELLDINSATAKMLLSDAAQLDAIKVNKISAADAMIYERTVQRQQEQAQADAVRATEIAKIAKPERPACHPWSNGKRWNGNYYGKPGNRSYYVDNNKHSISDDDYAICVAYDTAIAEYRARVDQIKKS